MPAHRAISETSASKHARCEILRAIVQCEPEPKQRNFARGMLVTDSTVSEWLKGRRPFGWDELYGSLARVADLHPDKLPGILALLAECVGAPVVVTLAEPVEDEPVEDFSTENNQKDMAWGRVLEARQSGDAKRIRDAVKAWEEECDDVSRVIQLEAK
jgi:hypothetical protein